MITDDFGDWSIALIEDGPIGGTCLNRECIPSKMLIYTADRALAARNNERFGLDATFGGAALPEVAEQALLEVVERLGT